MRQKPYRSWNYLPVAPSLTMYLEMRAKGMKNLDVYNTAGGLASPSWRTLRACLAAWRGLAPTRTTHQGRMSDREIDQQLVEKAQRGDKRAFEMLVVKYQRKLERLLSRIIRDPGRDRGRRPGSLHQGLPGAAQLPRRQRLLHLALPHRHQHREELPDRPGPARAHLDRVRQRGGRGLRGRRGPARHQYT